MSLHCQQLLEQAQDLFILKLLCPAQQLIGKGGVLGVHFDEIEDSFLDLFHVAEHRQLV